MRNVSRAWAYETGLAVGVELHEDIPVNEFYEYFGPDHKLDVRASNMEDMNSREYLERVRSIVLQNIRSMGGPPSVQMHCKLFVQLILDGYLTHPTAAVPQLPHDKLDDNEDEDMADPDERISRQFLGL